MPDCYNDPVLVGAITVASFFSFFSKTALLTLIGPLFLQQKLLKLLRPSRARGNLVQMIPLSFLHF